MSLPRQLYPTTRQICAALISEYLRYRKDNLWQSTFQQLVSKLGLSDLHSKRKKECEELIKKINAATSFSEKTKIIDILGKGARAAQELKPPQNLFGYALSFFIKDNSLWAKTQHAVRTCWVAGLKKSDDKDNFLVELSELQRKFNEYEFELNNDLDKSLVTPAETKKKRDEIFLQLLDRQDWTKIKFACNYNLFPLNMIPGNDVTNISAKIKNINTTIPLVYNDNYFMIFFFNELNGNHERDRNFAKEIIEQMELAKEESQHSKEASLLDEEFLKTIYPSELVMENVNSLQANESPSINYNIQENYEAAEEPSEDEIFEEEVVNPVSVTDFSMFENKSPAPTPQTNEENEIRLSPKT